jgi:hypothetical protein
MNNQENHDFKLGEQLGGLSEKVENLQIDITEIKIDIQELSKTIFKSNGHSLLTRVDKLEDSKKSSFIFNNNIIKFVAWIIGIVVLLAEPAIMIYQYQHPHNIPSIVGNK